MDWCETHPMISWNSIYGSIALLSFTEDNKGYL